MLLSCCVLRAACRVLQHTPCLFESDTGKQPNEISYDTIFKVFEQRRDWDTRAAKYPCTAHSVRMAFGNCAG